MDLYQHRYKTFDDLYEYCYRVASVVGLICIEIFGYKNPMVREHAIHQGLAFQMTNILRDVKVDAGLGRIYLPQEDMEKKIDSPVALRYVSKASSEVLLVDASVLIGSLLSDGIGDLITLGGGEKSSDSLRLSFNILQATRLRLSKTDFISCPSCGRTLFNLQTTTERIKTKMSHLKGVKIAIMGCIVNGPGEMADADFGYIGSGPKKVDLYVGKDRVRKNVPEERADETLIELIKAHAKWVEP